MAGMNQETGKLLDGLDHVRQSIKIILNTPVGSRVMLPEFGSNIIDLIDVPMTPTNQLRLYAETIEAIERWETRIEVRSVSLQGITAGGVIRLQINGVYEQREVTLEGVPIG